MLNLIKYTKNIVEIYLTFFRIYPSTYLIHDIKFDLNFIHRRFLVGLIDSVLDHASERTIGGSINVTGIFVGGNQPVNSLCELISGVTRFK